MRETWPPSTASRFEYVLVALAVLAVITVGTWFLNQHLSSEVSRRAACEAAETC